MNTSSQSAVRITYLYLVAFIGLIIMVIGVRDLVDFILEFVLPSERLGTETIVYFSGLRNGLASIIVGAPLWWYHWRIIQTDRSTNTADTTPSSQQ